MGVAHSGHADPNTGPPVSSHVSLLFFFWGRVISYSLYFYLQFHCIISRYLFCLVGEGNGNPPQCSCLESPVDRGAWWAAVHGVAQSQTRLKRLSMHACLGEGNGNPLQRSCLESLVDRGAWWAAVYAVAQLDTTEAT